MRYWSFWIFCVGLSALAKPPSSGATSGADCNRSIGMLVGRPPSAVELQEPVNPKPPVQKTSPLDQGLALFADLASGKNPSVQLSADLLDKLVKSHPRLALDLVGLLRARGLETAASAKYDRESLPVSYRAPGESAAGQMIHRYGLLLNQAQRNFDLEGTLGETVAAIRKAQAEGRAFSAAEYEAFWPSHGAAHGMNVATDSAMAARILAGEAEESYAALAGLAHDMGMHSGGAEVRRDHSHMAPFLALGGRVKGLETASENLETFVRQFSSDSTDPLAKLIREASETNYIRRQYPDLTPLQRRELLTREMFVGSLSHENGEGYDPKLGPDHLGYTRDAAMRLLGKTRIAGADQDSYNQAIGARYGGEFDRKFLSWLVASPEELAANPALAKLRDTYWKGECFLNFADPGRISGLGKTNGVGTTQSVVVETAEGAKLNHAIADPVTGAKVLIDSDSNRLGRYVVESGGFSPQAGKIQTDLSLSRLKLVEPSHYAPVLDDAARVVGQTAGYRARALAPLVGHSTSTKLHIPAEIPSGLREKFKADTIENFIHVELRNADTVLNRPDAALKNQSPLEYFAPQLKAWMKLPPTATEAELTKALSKVGADRKGVSQIALAPAEFRKHLGSHFSFSEDAYVATPRSDSSVDNPGMEGQQKLESGVYWSRAGTPKSVSFSSSGIQKKQIARRLKLAGAPAQPRTVTLADGNVVKYTGPEDLIPEDAEVLTLKKGAQLTKQGDLPGYGYILIEGSIRGERAMETGVAPFTATVSADSNAAASVVGFTSSFNLAGSTRNASTYIESDTATVIAVKLTPRIRQLYNGAVMAQSPAEVAETFGELYK